MIASIPTLRTERLVLRPMCLGDWDKYRDFMASEHAVHMGGPFALAHAWGMFCHDHAQWAFYGCGALMIDDAQSGECYGQVGVNHGPLFPEWELGWFLYPQAQGHGYATEAASALRQWARETRGLPTLVSYIDPLNLRSQRLAERLGATRDEGAQKQDEDDVVYRHYGKAC